MLITLSADSTSHLDWEVDPDLQGIYYLDFGSEALNPFDLAGFNSRLLAVEEFIRRFPQANRVILSRIDGNFSNLLSPSEKLQEQREEAGIAEEIFNADLFSEYLHGLASVLPDEIEPSILIELTDESRFAEMALLVSKRRFEHFKLIFSTLEIPIEGDANVMVSLPQDKLYQSTFFAPLYRRLKKFKCIPEELLNEHWDGVDVVIVDPETLGPSGKRMLYGFEAAGGIIVSMRGPLGFENETSLEDLLNS